MAYLPEKPPNWKTELTPQVLSKILSESEKLRSVIRIAQKEYTYWDKFKYHSFPKGISAKEAWAYLRITRSSNAESTPVKSEDGKKFVYTLTNELQRKLSFIDKNAAGLIKTMELKKPTESQKEQLIISGLSEEAIASSQIEGANTSRKVAKAMLLSGRKPKTKDEQMIINNYQVMQRLLDWKDLELSIDMLLEIQQNITTKTLDDESCAGRLRTDEDEIVIGSRTTGEVAFTPPKEYLMREELKRLIAYANEKEKDDDSFVYPVIKSSILHFWVAYLHPFVDGNGRTARAILYWYLLKKDYWLIQYLSISRVIKSMRRQYDDAFLHSEYDENDLTYMLNFTAEAIKRSIEQFLSYFEKKIKEMIEQKKIAERLEGFNNRQIALLQSLDRHRDNTVDIRTHQNKHGVSYQTARSDLLDLVEKHFLTLMRREKKFVFVSNTNAIKNLFKEK